MAAFAVFGGLAGLLTLTRVGLNAAGIPPPAEFLQPSALGELLDIIVIGAAGLLWNQEVSIKDANVQRIWEEFKRRKDTAASQKIVTKGDLRKRRKQTKQSTRARGFSKGAQQANPSNKAEDAEAEPRLAGKAEEKVVQQPAKAGGLLGSVKSAIDSANTTGRVQALQINDSLEQAGILKPLNAPDGEGTSNSSNGNDREPRSE
eukprot:CAMPEP_0117677622 /NCGR_PEP_ID=MMETSP0804-20121206/16843_1 /TAXON_ID=1074897 /ORGANISM="Tetraselmis astigmatica, Strain CCMP880" /LENGTH=203 /DNA_ID=CAMNT_0005486917 /DNA_START=1 /DNA_END=613 /DNA_ORIENTATION=+